MSSLAVSDHHIYGIRQYPRRYRVLFPFEKAVGSFPYLQDSMAANAEHDIVVGEYEDAWGARAARWGGGGEGTFGRAV
jgi:hypothetical protein